MASSGMMRTLAVFTLFGAAGAMRAELEVGNLETDVAAAAQNSSFGNQRWLMMGTLDDCAVQSGWDINVALPLLETMADPSVFFLDVKPTGQRCSLGMKVITQEASWQHSWGSKAVTSEGNWGKKGALVNDGGGNIEVPSSMASEGFTIIINERTRRWAIAPYAHVTRILDLVFPNFSQLSQWHSSNQLVKEPHTCHAPTKQSDVTIQGSYGAFKAWPQAIMRLEPTGADGGVDIDKVKAGQANEFTATIHYDGMFSTEQGDRLDSRTFHGVKASVVGAVGAAGKQKKSFKLTFNEYGGSSQDTGPEGTYFFGSKTVSLRANANDCTVTRELLMTDLYYAMCVPAYRQIPVRVFIKGAYYSTFLMTEWFDSRFVERAFGRPAEYTDALGDMGYGETFTELPSSNYYGQGYHLKPSKGCPGDSKEVDGLCKVSYSKASFFAPVGYTSDDQEREMFGQLVHGINAVTESDSTPMSSLMDVDKVLRAMAVDLATGQWDDFYRNYNNFFLFRESHGSGQPFYSVIPFDCDWSFHRKAFYKQDKDVVGFNADWDEFCCNYVGGFTGEKSKLITAIYKNQELHQKLIAYVEEVLTKYAVPTSSGSVSKIEQRLAYMWSAIGPDVKGDEFYGTCQQSMKVGKSYDDYQEIAKYARARACFLFGKMMQKHVGVSVEEAMKTASCK